MGKDYRVAQAAAGGTFCVTREANGDDAAQAVEGFHWMKAVSVFAHLQQPSNIYLKNREKRHLRHKTSL